MNISIAWISRTRQKVITMLRIMSLNILLNDPQLHPAIFIRIFFIGFRPYDTV